MSELINIIALVFSTISIMLSIFSYLRDRSDLRIKRIIFRTWALSKGILVVPVVNHGRRPIQIKRFGVKLLRRKTAFWPIEKVVLQETDEKEYKIDIITIFYKPLDIWKFKGFLVEDTFGKAYKYPSLNLIEQISFIVLKYRIIKRWKKTENEAPFASTQDNEIDDQLQSTPLAPDKTN